MVGRRQMTDDRIIVLDVEAADLFGVPIAVANSLNDRLGGARTFSDNIIFDAKWVDEIFSLASEDSLYLIRREFQIVDLSEAPNLLNLDPHNLTKAVAQMKREVVPHRAAGDAARLARFLMRSLP